MCAWLSSKACILPCVVGGAKVLDGLGASLKLSMENLEPSRAVGQFLPPFTLSLLHELLRAK